MLSKYTVFIHYYKIVKLLTNFESAYWNPPQISHLCDWSMFSIVRPSLDNVEMQQNISVTGGFRYDFSWSQAAFCMHLHGQNIRCMVSKRVAESVFVISKQLHRSKQDHWLRFL